VVLVGTDLDSAIYDTKRRREDIEAGLGTLTAIAHEWDPDVEKWVRAQREQDPRRVG